MQRSCLSECWSRVHAVVDMKARGAASGAAGTDEVMDVDSTNDVKKTATSGSAHGSLLPLIHAISIIDELVLQYCTIRAPPPTTRY